MVTSLNPGFVSSVKSILSTPDKRSGLKKYVGTKAEFKGEISCISTKLSNTRSSSIMITVSGVTCKSDPSLYIGHLNIFVSPTYYNEHKFVLYVGKMISFSGEIVVYDSDRYGIKNQIIYAD